MYNWPHRKKLRRKNYDYSKNWYYFVTICCYKNQCFFGEIIDWEMILNEYGEIVQEEINKTEEIRKKIKIDSLVIMPNHIHMVIEIVNANWWNTGRVRMHSHPTEHKTLSTKAFGGRGALWLKWNNLSSIIRAIKSSFTRKIRSKHNDYIFAWQRSFYDVIIKTEDQLEKSRQYILSNPRKWDLDMNNPDNEERVKQLKKQGKR